MGGAANGGIALLCFPAEPIERIGSRGKREMQTKIVGALMIAAIAIMVLPILNTAEKTRVQGKVNELLTQQNIHAYHDRERVQGMLDAEIRAIVGEDANMEVIMYHYQGMVPAADIEKPEDVPSLEGIKKSAAYYEVSALVARVFWVQTKLIGTMRDPDGYPIGSCYFCEDDARAQRIVFVPPEKMGMSYTRPPGDLDFVQDPSMLFE